MDKFVTKVSLQECVHSFRVFPGTMDNTFMKRNLCTNLFTYLDGHINCNSCPN